ncbi:MAG: T9SS type A sorting domain-containing protein [Bacteroidota bacterium]
MRFFTLVLAIAALPASAQTVASFEPLGFLDGETHSIAQAISSDGRVVVGSSGLDGFRWTDEGGMQPLGLPDGETIRGTASNVSADGSVIVGIATTSGWPGGGSWRWTQGGGMQWLGFMPHHHDPGRFDGRHGLGATASGVSGDGRVIVGGAVGHLGEFGPAVSEPFQWTAGGGMESLGGFPGVGGDLRGGAQSASSDGSVIVGYSRWVENFADTDQAFLWTPGGGMERLGTLPDHHSSRARDVTPDGLVVVGISFGSSGSEGFLWTESDGMRSLGMEQSALAVSDDGSVVAGMHQGEGAIWTEEEGVRVLRTILEDDNGVDLSSWGPIGVTDISGDGSIVIGTAIGPNGQVQAWRVVFGDLNVTSPISGELVTAGEPLTIRWTRPQTIDAVDVYILPDTLGAEAELIDFNTDADSLVWQVPDSLFSRSARIIVEDVNNEAVADTSAPFRIKPDHLTRLSADGTRYVPFAPATHGWRFSNRRINLFPPSWQLQNAFDYRNGTDPFSNDEYDDDFPDPPINAIFDAFPDWPAFVRAFGTDAAYHLIIDDVEAFYRDRFTAFWGSVHKGETWGGSCSGMSVLSLVAFGQPDALATAHPEIGRVDSLHTVALSDGVREVINTKQVYWNGAFQKAFTKLVRDQSPRDVLARLREMLRSEDRGQDGYLYISNRDTSGAHAVVPYRLRRDPGNAARTWVYVYDPNRPRDANTFVVIDSLANRWFYANIDKGGWGGSDGMFVMDPAVGYLAQAVPPYVASSGATRRPTGQSVTDEMYIAVTPDAEATLRASNGAGHIGYDPETGTVIGELAGAVPDIPPVGGPTPPQGYVLPRGGYTLSVGGASDERLSATVIDDGQIVAYGRSDAGPTQTDHLRLSTDGGVTLRTEGGTAHRTRFRTMLPDGRTLEARNLTVSGEDSVRVSTTNGSAGPQLVIANHGAAHSYSVRFRQAASGGGGLRHARANEVTEFVAFLDLEAGATHTLRPSWSTLGDDTTELDVDLDGDGTPDETRTLVNQVASGPGGPVAELALAVAPNPVRGVARVRFELAEAGPVELSVFDLLGRRVATVLDGVPHSVGAHEARLDASAWPSGVYVVRLAARDEARTTRITVVR